MNKEEFMEFLSGLPIIESDWELSDFRISTDYNSAHISLFNTGNFVSQTDSTRIRKKYEWLESAYMVKEEVFNFKYTTLNIHKFRLIELDSLIQVFIKDTIILAPIFPILKLSIKSTGY